MFIRGRPAQILHIEVRTRWRVDAAIDGISGIAVTDHCDRDMAHGLRTPPA